jgi:penicillin-binding protein 1A
VLYTHNPEPPQILVAQYVAAEITDLLQTAVNIGTGRAAQIGRPVAGKTGTTTSDKDGWFLGFSSGITTGVWMGRDDAHAVPGLQGGAAPARAFAAYMRLATAKRPPEVFETQVQLPNWTLEPDDEVNLAPGGGYAVPDANGQFSDPTRDQPGIPGPAPGDEPANSDNQDLVPAGPPAANDDFLDQATGRRRAPSGDGVRVRSGSGGNRPRPQPPAFDPPNPQ